MELTEELSQEENELSDVALLESILFVASGPVSANRLATALDVTVYRINQLLQEMVADYQTRGLRLQWNDDGVQLTTAPAANEAVERFFGLELTTRLSQAALEVLAIVAYMQPATRPRIDQVRGVNSDAALRTLLSKGLVQELGRMETPGRPILYGTTTEFLQHFGLAGLAQLPVLAAEEEE